MSTATLTRKPTPAPAPASLPRTSSLHVLRAEWTKLRSVRSTLWSLAAAAAAVVGLGAASCAAAAAYADDPQTSQMMGLGEPTGLSLSGVTLAQLAIAVLGVLVIGSEYGTGMIRTTLAAVPNRRTLLAAKAVVVAVASFAVGLTSAFVAFLLGQAVLGSSGVDSAALGDPGVARAVVGAGLYLAVLSLLAYGLGVVIRHTAGAISAVVGLVLVLPLVVNFLPQQWQDTITKYLPSTAGGAISAVTQQPDMLSPWAGLGVFALYAAAALVAANLLITRRDA